MKHRTWEWAAIATAVVAGLIAGCLVALLLHQ
jgi:ABC-type uncharacterized transport system permease subunit